MQYKLNNILANTFLSSVDADSDPFLPWVVPKEKLNENTASQVASTFYMFYISFKIWNILCYVELPWVKFECSGMICDVIIWESIQLTSFIFVPNRVTIVWFGTPLSPTTSCEYNIVNISHLDVCWCNQYDIIKPPLYLRRHAWLTTRGPHCIDTGTQMAGAW